jgi:CheY-like chemotaxis protein
MLFGSERARDLVKQVLAFSRQSSETLKAIRIGCVVEEVLRLVRVSLPSTIEIQTRIEDDAYGVMADPTQVHQIFMNLCTNAHHAMGEEGGVLEVEVAPVELTPASRERPHDLPPGTYIEATVRDTGHGMDRTTREKIFEPYFTTKQKGMGTGLGLAMVHGIMTKQGGAVTVESEPGKGAIFALYFPTIQMDHRSLAESQGADVPTGHERILLIDDEQQLLDTGRIILEHLGYEVATHTRSVEALTHLRSHPDRYDLVITDLTMPDLTGDKLAEEVMRIRSDLPVILCTGYVEEALEERTKAMGIQTIIMKPILMKDLAGAVRRELDGNQGASE